MKTVKNESSAKIVVFITYDVIDSELSFSILSDTYTSSDLVTNFVSLTYVYGSSTQEVNMLYQSDTTEYFCSGTIYTATFNSSTKYIYDFYTNCPYSSLEDDFESLLGTSTSAMLTGVKQILSESSSGVTLYTLGFSRW